MTTMQKKITFEIERIAQVAGFEVVQSMDFANVGTFFFQKEGEFENKALVGVSFHADYATMDFTGKGYMVAPPNQRHYIEYKRPESANCFLADLKKRLS
jgi:hypothetical protein